jgi:hypothetical protein
MIGPVLAGVAALYGYYRYQKSKEQKALDAALTTPPGFATAPTPAVTGPSARMFKAIGQAVTSQVRANAAPVNPAIYGQGATTADVPSGRIPSSAYGATGPTAPSSTPGINATAGFTFKL